MKIIIDLDKAVKLGIIEIIDDQQIVMFGQKKAVKRFIPPTVEAVREFCIEARGNNVDPVAFVNFYESKGWMVGKNKMKDWKAAVRTWESKEKKGTTGTGGKMARAAESLKNANLGTNPEQGTIQNTGTGTRALPKS